MKFLFVFVLASLGYGQLQPSPACYSPIKRGNLTIQCSFVVLPQIGGGPFSNELLLMISADTPQIMSLRVSAKLSSASGSISRYTGADEFLVTWQTKAFAILYIPAGQSWTLDRLDIEQVTDMGDFSGTERRAR